MVYGKLALLQWRKLWQTHSNIIVSGTTRLALENTINVKKIHKFQKLIENTF